MTLMDFSVSNPNKKTRINHDMVQVLVLDKTGDVISSSMLDAFYQQGSSQTLLHANGEAKRRLSHCHCQIRWLWRLRLLLGLILDCHGKVKVGWGPFVGISAPQEYLIGKLVGGWSTRCLAYLLQDFYNAAAADHTNSLLHDWIMWFIISFFLILVVNWPLVFI